jgi:hypothetical protein
VCRRNVDRSAEPLIPAYGWRFSQPVSDCRAWSSLQGHHDARHAGSRRSSALLLPAAVLARWSARSAALFQFRSLQGGLTFQRQSRIRLGWGGRLGAGGFCRLYDRRSPFSGEVLCGACRNSGAGLPRVGRTYQPIQCSEIAAQCDDDCEHVSYEPGHRDTFVSTNRSFMHDLRDCKVPQQRRLRRRSPEVFSGGGISDGDDDGRVPSRVLGPIRNDALGRRGPYDRGHDHVRPSPIRRRRRRRRQ